MIPHRTPFFLPLLYPSLHWRQQPADRQLYLTFDDGPVPGPTEYVLDTLASHKIKGTFFCIGDNVARYPELFRRVLEEGHAIGNHTFHHINGWRTTVEHYHEDVLACQREFQKHIQQPVTLFRPPYGRITRRQIRELSAFNIVMWDVLSLDYNQRLSQERCLNNTLSAVRPGSIIVFHDSYKAERNMMYALPRLIDYGLRHHYTFHSLHL